jgi:hypothetical protein
VKLAEALGYRSPYLYGSSVAPRVAARVADISGGRAAAEGQLDADRWLGEGGGRTPEALGEAVAVPRPRTGPVIPTTAQPAQPFPLHRVALVSLRSGLAPFR